jgi:hypothetical protein
MKSKNTRKLNDGRTHSFLIRQASTAFAARVAGKKQGNA